MQNFTERVVSALSSGKVEFIVVGGVSAVLQGAPIVTRDLDVCYRRTSDNLREIQRNSKRNSKGTHLDFS